VLGPGTTFALMMGCWVTSIHQRASTVDSKTWLGSLHGAAATTRNSLRQVTRHGMDAFRYARPNIVLEIGFEGDNSQDDEEGLRRLRSRGLRHLGINTTASPTHCSTDDSYIFNLHNRPQLHFSPAPVRNSVTHPLDVCGPHRGDPRPGKASSTSQRARPSRDWLV
jgi:hypothetical protein